MTLKQFLSDHTTLTLVLVFVIALLVFPLDEVLFVAAAGLFGMWGILAVILLLVALFLASRRTGWGQRWWGRAYGTLEGWLR